MSDPQAPVRTVDATRWQRVALIAGGLSQGGAEKQLLYMARALQQRGIDVRCYCLTRGDFYQPAFEQSGIPVIWIGRFQTPLLRLARLIPLLRAFHPQAVQAGHFFTNLYAALGARACGAISIGAIRNDGAFELAENKGWGPWLMRLPTLVVANSRVGARFAQTHGRGPDGVVVIPNVIDLQAFDRVVATTESLRERLHGPIAIAVGRLVPAKRFDRFLESLVLARRSAPSLSGVIVGDGPERRALEAQAAQLGLGNDSLLFLGRRDDVPALLRQADMLVACSDHEGFPNVLLEAMAAGLPSITTPAGDAASVVLPNVTGVVVESDNVQELAGAMVRLAMAPARRAAMSRAARQRVERVYRPDWLAESLVGAYQQARARARVSRLASTVDGQDVRAETGL